MVGGPGAGIALPEPRKFFALGHVPLAAVLAGVGFPVVLRDVIEGHGRLLGMDSYYRQR
jgi:hypothetical protein